jgi:hypothetical protein
MRTLALFVVALVCAAAAILTSSVAVSAQVLAKYPSLRCSACRATCEVLGGKMNETADPKKTILTSHRLEKNERRTSYVNSELRGYDLIEKLCDQNNYGAYMLREERRTGLRIFSKEGPLQQVMPYDDEDRKDLHDQMANKFVSRLCEEILEEHEEALVGIIKKVTLLEELQREVCDKKMKVCVGKKYDKGVKEDLARRAAWRKKTGIRTGTDVDNEKREKEEAEAKAKAEGTATPAADAAAADGTATPTAAPVDPVVEAAKEATMEGAGTPAPPADLKSDL